MEHKRPKYSLLEKPFLLNLCRPGGPLTGQIYYQQGWGKAAQLVKGPYVKDASCPVPHLLTSEQGESFPICQESASFALDEEMKDEFAETSAVCFVVSLPEPDLRGASWRPVGPADYRRYKILESGGLSPLLRYLTTELCMQLSSFTRLNLGKVLSFEVCQFTAGDYRMLNDCYPEPAGLDVILMHSDVSSQEGRGWHYLVEGEEQFMMPIKQGWLMGLVYRTEGVRRFQRRLSQSSHVTCLQILLTFAVLE